MVSEERDRTEAAGEVLGPRGDPPSSGRDRAAVTSVSCGAGAFVVTLALGMCCGFIALVAGVGLAIAAVAIGGGVLVRARREGVTREDRGLALSGIALGGLYLLLLVAGVGYVLVVGFDDIVRAFVPDLLDTDQPPP